MKKKHKLKNSDFSPLKLDYMYYYFHSFIIWKMKFFFHLLLSIKWSFEHEHKGLSQENFVNKQELCMCCNGFVVLGDIYASSLHLIRNMGIFTNNNARDQHMHANN